MRRDSNMIVGSANCRLMRTQRCAGENSTMAFSDNFHGRAQNGAILLFPLPPLTASLSLARPFLVKVPNSRNILSYFAAKPQQQQQEEGREQDPRTVCFIIEPNAPTTYTTPTAAQHTTQQQGNPTVPNRTTEAVFESCIKYEIKKLTKIVKRKKLFKLTQLDWLRRAGHKGVFGIVVRVTPARVLC